MRSKRSSKAEKMAQEAMDTSDNIRTEGETNVKKERSASPVVSEHVEKEEIHPFMVWKLAALAKAQLSLPRATTKPTLKSMDPPPDPYKDVTLPPEASSFIENPSKRQDQCDVLLVAGSKLVPCHMELLSCYSKLFKQQFAGKVAKKSADLRRQSVTLPDPSNLLQVVDLLYTGCPNVTLEMAKQLLPAASLMQLDYLSSKCVEVLKESLNEANCLELKFLAINSSNVALSQAVDYTWHINFESILNSNEFLELPVEKMVQLMEKGNLHFPPPNIDYLVDSWLSHGGRRFNSTVFIQLETVKYFRDSKKNEMSIFDKKPPEVQMESSEIVVPGWVYLSSIITPKNANHACTPGRTKRGEVIKVKLIDGVDAATPNSGSKRRRQSEADNESKVLGKRKISDHEQPCDSPVQTKIPKREIILVSVETQTDFVPEVKKEPPTLASTPAPPQNFGNNSRFGNNTPAPAPASTGDEDWDNPATTYTGVTAPPPSESSGGGGGYGRQSFGDRGGRGGFRGNDNFNGGGGGFGRGGGRGGFGGNRFGDGGGDNNGDDNGSGGGFGRGGGRGGRGGFGGNRFGDGGGDNNGDDNGSGGGFGRGGGRGGRGGFGGNRFGDGGGDNNGDDNGGNDRMGGGGRGFRGGRGGYGGGNDRFGGDNDRSGGGGGDRFGGGGDRFGGGDRGGGRGGRGGRGGFNRSEPPAEIAPDEDWDNPGATSTAPAAVPPTSNNSENFGGGGRFGGTSRNDDSSGGDGGGGFGRGGRGGRGGFSSNRFDNENGGGGNRFGGGNDGGGYGGGRGGYGGGRNNGDDANDNGGGRGGRGGFGGGRNFGGDNDNDQGGGGGFGGGGGRGGRGGYGGGRNFGGDQDNDQGGGGGRGGRGGYGGGRNFGGDNDNDQGGGFGGGRGGRGGFGGGRNFGGDNDNDQGGGGGRGGRGGFGGGRNFGGDNDNDQGGGGGRGGRGGFDRGGRGGFDRGGRGGGRGGRGGGPEPCASVAVDEDWG